MKVLEKSTPARRSRQGATSDLPVGLETNSPASIPPGVLTTKSKSPFYQYAGEHPNGYPLFKHPLRGFVRFVEHCPIGLTTAEWDALEAYADQEAEARFQDEQDAIAKERVYGVMS